MPNTKFFPISLRIILVALVVGGLAMMFPLFNFIVPIPGTAIYTDPRELFCVVGAALTGPAGALIIGFMAGITDPHNPLSISLAHMISGLWAAYAYRFFIFAHIKHSGWKIVAWLGMVVAYYVVFLIPALLLLPPALAVPGSFLSKYANVFMGALPEIAFTLLSTSIVMVILPRRYRHPL